MKASELSRPIPGRLSVWAGAAWGAVGRQRAIRLTWRGQDPVTKGPGNHGDGDEHGRAKRHRRDLSKGRP